ncbi:hypothetical protein [Mucilaginibacter sp. HD30]
MIITIMNVFQKLTVFCVLVVINLSIAQGQSYTYKSVFDKADETASNAIDRMSLRMRQLMDHAIDRQDFILEARMKDVGLMLDGMKNFVENQGIKTLDKLSEERQATLKQLDGILAKTVDKSTVNFEQFLATSSANLQNIVNSLPTVKNQFEIYMIDGITQSFKNDGVYEITFTGNAFVNSVNQHKVVVGDKEYPLHTRASTSSAYIQIPATDLTGHFSDTEARRIKFTITSKRESKTIVSFSSTILLHPRYPFKYILKEIDNTYRLSNKVEIGVLSQKMTVADTETMIEASVPDGAEIDSATTEFYDGGTKASSGISTAEYNRMKEVGWWHDAPRLINSNKTIIRPYFSATQRTVWILPHFRRREQGEKNAIVRYLNYTDPVTGGLKQLTNGYIAYGTYRSDYFTNDYVSYELILKPFFGDSITINPTSPGSSADFVEAEVGAERRLTIKVKPAARY